MGLALLYAIGMDTVIIGIGLARWVGSAVREINKWERRGR